MDRLMRIKLEKRSFSPVQITSLSVTLGEIGVERSLFGASNLLSSFWAGEKDYLLFNPHPGRVIILASPTKSLSVSEGESGMLSEPQLRGLSRRFLC
jgi:hypothetical protein